jgi:integrase
LPYLGRRFQRDNSRLVRLLLGGRGHAHRGNADKAAPLFPTAAGRTGKLTDRRMTRTDVLRMIWRRAAAAGIATELGCHSFRATGITVYLKNGGLLEHAQQMAAHESARTTKLYDRRCTTTRSRSMRSRKSCCKPTGRTAFTKMHNPTDTASQGRLCADSGCWLPVG